jgi:hypothetical protein
LSIKRPEGIPAAKDSGNCKATETTLGVREARISSSLAPEERPVCLKARERFTGLLLFLSRVRNFVRAGLVEFT